jgi:hypothetical protein
MAAVVPDGTDDNKLKIIVSGGGPVGLSFALMLHDLMPGQVAIEVYDSRWRLAGRNIAWKGEETRNSRRQQVVTLQSRQFSKLSHSIQHALFDGHGFTEMWPVGPDSVNGLRPRNLRISHIEDRLLEACNAITEITPVPEPFNAENQTDLIRSNHLLVIAEGAVSKTREHFLSKFGRPSTEMYSLEGNQVRDVVLGLRVKSKLTSATAVLLTIAQNRFLLNAIETKDGLEGFLNMRLAPEEVREVVGIIDQDTSNDPNQPPKYITVNCIQSSPCLMEFDPRSRGRFKCATHGSFFFPPLLKDSPLWRRIQSGLELFAVSPKDLSAVTAFRLEMVQRPRFTAQLFERTRHAPGTYGCLIGDAANAIHFWPGRGLNSGLSSAVSLARTVHAKWRGQGFRDADFMRHEAVMAMLQYRHKARAWRQMVVTTDIGKQRPISALIGEAISPRRSAVSPAQFAESFFKKLVSIRDRLSARLPGMPDDAALRKIVSSIDPETLKVLVHSRPWDTYNAGGDEVEIDQLYNVSSAEPTSRPVVNVRHAPLPQLVPEPTPPRPPAPTATTARRRSWKLVAAALLVMLMIVVAAVLFQGKSSSATAIPSTDTPAQ